MANALQEFAPDIVHFHGTCYQLTSSVVHAAQRAGVKRLATLHEYKLACANQRLWDDSRQAPCTACVGAKAVSRRVAPVRRRCIKSSLGASVIGSVEDGVASLAWRRDEDLMLHAPSQFMLTMMTRDGWNARRLFHLDLPWDVDSRQASAVARNQYLYMGRLAPEKDVETLLRAWGISAEDTAGYELVIAGDGAASVSLKALSADLRLKRVRFVGKLDPDELRRELQVSTATLHPAAWYENSPMAVRESLSAGIPALVARNGGMPELVDDGKTGRIVNHSVQGWAAALADLTANPLPRGERVREQVRVSRPDAAAHLDALLDRYESCRGVTRGSLRP